MKSEKELLKARAYSGNKMTEIYIRNDIMQVIENKHDYIKCCWDKKNNKWIAVEKLARIEN